MTAKMNPAAARAVETALARHMVDVGAVEAREAADPLLPSKELGELVVVELEDGRTIAFARPLPLLTYNASGLLILGGAYKVVRDVFTNTRGKAPTRAALPKDAKAIAAGRVQYMRDHWGKTGPRTAARMLAADPRQLSRRLSAIVAVTYRTEKGKDRELTDYRHPFKKPLPVLSYHEGGLVISGGKYHVNERGIID